MSTKLVLEIRGLTKRYGAVLALDRVDLKVKEGEFVSIMGPSGSGKTTLLNLIGALDRPTEGDILVEGRQLSRMEDLDSFRNREVGFIFQFCNLIPTLTASENVQIPMYETRIPSGERRRRAQEALTSVGLGNRLDHKPAQLSGGERQRVAIARALVNDPAIILADEPTGELDTATGGEIVRLMRKIGRERNKTIVMVTHNPEVANKTDRIVRLRDGKIEREETVRGELLEDLVNFQSSALARRMIAGETIEDPDLEKLGVIENGELGRYGRPLRELLVALKALQEPR